MYFGIDLVGAVAHLHEARMKMEEEDPSLMYDAGWYCYVDVLTGELRVNY